MQVRIAVSVLGILGLGQDNQGYWDLGHESPGGVFGCMHDLSLDALCKAGSAHNAPWRWCRKKRAAEPGSWAAAPAHACGQTS